MKLCECGCGEPAPLATRTSRRHGTVKGEPQRFVRGHRWAVPDWYTRYREEDRGYRTPCWIYTGYINTDNGYGYLGRKPVHRLMFERVHGPLPKGLEPDHLCRVRACMRPEHLEAVTRAENARRSPLVGRTPKPELRRLTDAALAEILATPPGTRGLARRFGITKQAIQELRQRGGYARGLQ